MWLLKAKLSLCLALCLGVQLAASRGLQSEDAADEAGALLELRAAFDNWDELVARHSARLSGWAPHNPDVCGWSFVECKAGRVHRLRLDRRTWQAYWPKRRNSRFPLADDTLHAPLHALTQPLHGLPQLKGLLLSQQALRGSIPAEWAQPGGLFSRLEMLDLSANRLSGTLPALQAPSTLTELRLADNQVSGPLPPGWAYAFPELESVQLASNRLSGRFPPEWLAADAFPRCATAVRIAPVVLRLDPAPGPRCRAHSVILAACDLGGALPAPAAPRAAAAPGTPGLALHLGGNKLSGSLPASWGAAPMRLFTSVSLANNRLTGRIPASYASWLGTNLTDSLMLDHNNLEGPIPALLVRAAALASLIVKPGNEGLCIAGGRTIATQRQQPAGPLAAVPPCTTPAQGPALPALLDLLPGAGVLGAIALLVARHMTTLRRRQRQATDSPPLPQAAAARGLEDVPLLERSAAWGLDSASARIQPGALHFARSQGGELVVLGVGGCGSVYAGRLHGTLPVAIKEVCLSAVPGAATLAPGQALERFWGEVALLRSLAHPNVVQLLGVAPGRAPLRGADGGLGGLPAEGQEAQQAGWLIVMELMAGGALSQQLEQPEMRWRQRGAHIAADAARAVAWLHSHSVVHMDIKSLNLLLDARSGRAKLSDVGMARMLGQRSTVSGVAGCTLAYAAPEVLMGQRAGPPSDIFSLGWVLYEIITGNRLMRRMVFGSPRVPEQCPAAIAELVRSCLEVDPRQRPSAQHVLRVIVDSLPTGGDDHAAPLAASQ